MLRLHMLRLQLFKECDTYSHVHFGFPLQQAPAEAVDGSSPWEIADGFLYPEDILDDSPYLFVEIPGRMTGSYSGYNVDPLYVVVDTIMVKEAFIAGVDNGLKPLNVAALKYIDQVLFNVRSILGVTHRERHTCRLPTGMPVSVRSNV